MKMTGWVTGLLLVAGAAGGCAAITGLDDFEVTSAAPIGGGGPGEGECIDHAECDDANRCTADVCSFNRCLNDPLSDFAVVKQLECADIGCITGQETLFAHSQGEPCSLSGTCQHGMCKFTNGTSCSSDDECSSGNCAGGVCCASDCGVCQTCDEDSGCTYTPRYENHGDCAEGRACDGAGQCRRKNGEPCSAYFECLSGLCSTVGNTKVCAAQP